MISRHIISKIKGKLGGKRAILLTGPRQVGKSTLILEILKKEDFLFLNGDDPAIRESLNNPNTEQIKNIIGTHTMVFIDEAQRIEHIGLTAKIIIDQLKEVSLILTGSSALEINDKIVEPLTGRKWEFQLFPISWFELENHLGFVQSQQQLPIRLKYGMYPDVINNPGEEVIVLKELVNSYLFKDVLALSGIRKPQVLEKLLKALAYQIGNEVSYNELSSLIGVDKNTVSDYIDLLCQAFVIFKLPSFKRNLRNELKRAQKIYFYDIGIRNTVVGNYEELGLRNDTGAIWENFLISERMKMLRYNDRISEMYFWRTVNQQEIDYVEVERNKVKSFEFKWNKQAKTKMYKSFVESYDSELEVIHPGNFHKFVKAEN